MKKKIAAAIIVLVTAGLFAWYYANRPTAKTVDEKISEFALDLSKSNLPYELWQVPDFERFLLSPNNLRGDISEWVLANFEVLNKRLNLYSGIPEAVGLSELFRRSAVGVVTGGQHGQLSATFVFYGNPNPDTEALKKSLKLLYFGDLQRNTVLGGKGASGAEYVSEIDALLIPCLVFKNQVVRDAAVFHELKHAQQDHQARAFGIRPNLKANGRISDLLADHEVEAHEFSGKILDAGTTGAFMKSIRKVTTSRKANTPVEFFLSLRPDDLRPVDDLFGKAGSLEAALRHSFIYHSVVFDWVEQNFPAESWRKTKREFYLSSPAGQR